VLTRGGAEERWRLSAFKGVHIKMSHESSTGTALNTHTNRLAGETSTYLLQHAHNPVDWYPWGEAALARAKAEDKPILLSIGYAACHWCHVMEHESFEDPDTAKMMNENFICIKVDREERPDLDEIYMRAVQLMTGHGGWPMTVFLTPNLEPFFGGTYYPPEDRHGMPSFKHVMTALTEAWRHKRQEIEDSARDISQTLKSMDKLPVKQPLKIEAKEEFDRSAISAAGEKVLSVFDHSWGGFGSSPKFPHTFSISLGMRCASHPYEGKASLRESFSEMVSVTLDKMAYGGINDQIGGGFARYSVDRKWLIPHFEKMLYDNALLCQNYVDGYFLTDRKYWKAVAEQILNFVLRELRTADGAFYSSLDADSEGEEGKFYVFTAAEVGQVLGADADWFSKVYGVTKVGNFEHGTNVLHLTAPPEELAHQFQMSEEAFWAKLKPLAHKLFEYRAKRVRPGRDEKVLTSWNSLMISAFVDGYKLSGQEQFLEAASQAAEFIRARLLIDHNRLLRTWGKGKAKLNAYLDDYAFYVQALLDLASVHDHPGWVDLALRLTESMLARFSDEEKIGFYFTSDDHESLLARPRSHFDGSLPSGTSVVVFNLLRLSKLTDNQEYRKRAEKILHHYQPAFASMPDQFAHLIEAMDFACAKPIEIVLVQSGESERARELLLEIHRHYLPNKVVIVKDTALKLEGKTAGTESSEIALLKQRDLVKGSPAVYVCENFACDEPITTVAALNQKMKSLSQTLKLTILPKRE
jgi:uncharacterized protein